MNKRKNGAGDGGLWKRHDFHHGRKALVGKMVYDQKLHGGKENIPPWFIPKEFIHKHTDHYI